MVLLSLLLEKALTVDTLAVEGEGANMSRIIEARFDTHIDSVRVVVSDDFESCTESSRHVVAELTSRYRGLIPDIAETIRESLASHERVGSSREKLYGLPVIDLVDLWTFVNLEEVEIFPDGEFHLYYVVQADVEVRLVIYLEDWDVVGGQAR